MKRITLLTTALALAFSLPTFATTPATGADKSIVERCEHKAKEHKVSKDKMQSYLNSCEQKEIKKAQAHTTAPARKAE